MDHTVREICINGSDVLFIYRSSRNPVQKSSLFETSLDASDWCQDFALSCQVRLDPNQAYAGGRFQEDFRWHILMNPLAHRGPYICFRRVKAKSFCLEDFDDPNNVLPIVIEHFKKKLPLLICGETNSGKTSLLSTLIRLHCQKDRWICLEQTPEIPPIATNWVHLCASHPDVDQNGAYSLSTLFAEALRMRPDRILIGEIRKEEAAAFLDSLDVGIKGSVGTIHAACNSSLVRRLEILSKRNKVEKILVQQKLAAVFMERGNASKPPSLSTFYLFSD